MDVGSKYASKVPVIERILKGRARKKDEKGRDIPPADPKLYDQLRLELSEFFHNDFREHFTSTREERKAYVERETDKAFEIE